MRRVATLAVVVAGLAFVGVADAVSPSFTAARLSSTDVRRMVGTSWHRGCPVALADLRLVTATYWGFDKRAHTGRIVVHRDVATEVVAVLRRLYPVDAYGGSDYRSIEADNTSAFNCRYVDGTTRWSEHAYGRAIDLNPIENPYVTSSGTTSHPASRRYLRRAPYRRGMAVEGGAVVRAFDAVGWGWGGRWSGDRDYQHFSASGR